MSNKDETRTYGPPDSGEAAVDTSTAGTTTILQTKDGVPFQITEIHVQYANGGAGNPSLILEDAPDGDAPGDIDADQELRTFMDLTADEDIHIEEPTIRDIEDDVVIEADGNGDSDAEVFIGGNYVQTG